MLVLVTDRCVLKMDHHCPWWVRCGLLAPKLNLLKINVKNTLLTSLFLSIFYRVNNCVGFSNYKFFILFLTYSLVYCLFIAASVLQYFIKFWTVSRSLTFHHTPLWNFCKHFHCHIVSYEGRSLCGKKCDFSRFLSAFPPCACHASVYVLSTLIHAVLSISSVCLHYYSKVSKIFK